ncbi:MAG: YdaS family helix-turn-helix protein [Methyloglobulus sp.]
MYAWRMKNEALQKAIKSVGTQTLLAKRLGISQQRLQWWTKNTLPAEWVIQVEKETGVPRHELRPDIYPPSEINL